MSEECSICTKVREGVDSLTTENVLTLDMVTSVVYGTGKQLKPARKELLGRFLQYVCALRNSGGGLLLIHLTERQSESRDLQAFSEFVDVRLNAMIEDDTLFVDNYERSWLRERFKNDLEDDKAWVSETVDFVVLEVKSSTTCSTSDFKTKIPLDGSLIDPSARNIPKLYNVNTDDKMPSSSEPVHVDWSQQFVPLFESRCVQLKSFGVGVQIPSTLEGKASLIWNGLKLKDNITSMTKVLDGGSYYCGVEEIKENVGSYKVVKSKVHGMALSSDECNALRDEIIRLVKGDMKWTTKTNVVTDDDVIDDVTNDEVIKDVIQIEFHSVWNRNYVMQVSVKYFNGLVFYDKHGPECFCIYTDPRTGEWGIRRILFHDWIERVCGGS